MNAEISNGGVDKNHGGHSVTAASDDDNENNEDLYPCPSVCQ